MTRALAIALSLLAACSLDADDVGAALRQAEETNSAGVADTTCGFSTFGLRDVRIDALVIDGREHATATVSGTAVDGARKGEACGAAVKFRYTKARSITQGHSTTVRSDVAIISDLERVGPPP